MNRDEVGFAVRQIASCNGAKLDLAQISDDTAMSQDAKIDGIDVWDFAKDLERTFGDMVWTVPWGRFSDQRASFYGWRTLLGPVWLLWRLGTWPIRGEFVPPPNGGNERLALGHLADVLHVGHWIEPGEL